MPHFDSKPPPPRAPEAARGAGDLASNARERVIGERYQVVQQLGRGGMGVVYRVRDTSTGRELALKQLMAAGSDPRSQAATSLFEREFYVLAQLAHPRVIAVHDYGVAPEGPYYTMELLDGGDLKALAPLEPRRACTLMLDVCSSLALLHARRLIHRDITPRNVRCTRDGRAKLIDFGAMVPMGPCTQTVGTPAYVAPEVLHRGALDARSDLFSLGATLYHALTGHAPFAASSFSDLREAWSAPLLPPSHWAADIPPALDALCNSLLQIDPAQRPRSVFDVMQRLAAVAGVERAEDAAVVQAYLATPALVGRDDQLQRFRQRMRRALHGQGGALRFEGPAGCGRSRLLDACALEAKTLGACVLRAAAQASADTPFAVAEQLAGQLLQTLPDAAAAAAARAGVEQLLFESLPTDNTSRRLRALRDPALDGSQLRAALGAWFAGVCETHALLIAVDDARSIDSASLAFLAGLALQAADTRLLLCSSCVADVPEPGAPAFAVLAQHSAREDLPALSRAQIEALLASIFGQVPRLTLLSDRLFGLALGNPRETLALAQHLVDTQAIRYADAQWTLPADLDSGQLPETAAQVFIARIRALPELARLLAQAHALVGGVMRWEDYAVLAPGADARARDAALTDLLAQAILQSDGELHSLSSQALADALLADLDPLQKRERHLVLYELYRRRPDSHPFLLVHHLFEAERTEQALDLLAQKQTTETEDYTVMVRLGASRLAATLEHALHLALESKRPAREIHELRRKLCGLAQASADDALYVRVAPSFIAQLERDSGLHDYRALDSSLEPAVRLQRALSAAVSRYQEKPEHDRVYRVDEAIKHLALAVVSWIAVAQRTRETSLLPNHELLEPFVSLSPPLAALCDNTRATRELYFGRYVTARRIWRDVHERLGSASPDSVRFVQDIRAAVAWGIAQVEIWLGGQNLHAWLTDLDALPTFCVSVQLSRRRASLMRGDVHAADHFARSAEQLALRINAAPLFAPDWMSELQAVVHLRDLAGVRRVIEAVTPLAARRGGWRPLLLAARGHLDLLRGELTNSRTCFERAVELARPSSRNFPYRADVWCVASAGAIACLTELDDHAGAIEIGERALATCDAFGVDLLWHEIAQALAVAEAEHGALQRGAARLDALIETQRELEMQGLRIAQSYARRALIAIWAGDAASASRYAALARAEPGGEKVLAVIAQGEPLLAEARKAGIDLALAPTEFEASVLGTAHSAALDYQVANSNDVFARCPTAADRAARALELVCELAGAPRGQLYLVDARGELTPVASRNGSAPDADATHFARGFFAQQIDDASFTAGLTQATHMLSVPGAASYVDIRGHQHRLFMLTCKARGELVYVGLAVASEPRTVDPDPRMTAQLALIAAGLLAAGDTPGTRAQLDSDLAV
ncbi:MAG TPA: protein kinase [Polyangiales bacterium]|nr:protein kinase [Polyangiales bacterium]